MRRSAATHRPLLGIVLMLGFCLVAPTMDAAAKILAQDVPTGQIATLRFAMQSILLLPIVLLTGRFYVPDWAELRLHLIRAAMILGATAAFFSAIAEMPLADAMAIFFVEPFILTLMSAAFLGEAIGWRRILTCITGFGGALLIIQPAFQNVGWVAGYPLITAFLFAIYMLLTRRMAQEQDPVTMQAYTGLAAVVIGAPLLWLANGSGNVFLDPVAIPQDLFALFAFIGVMATVSHICLSYALSYAPASLIAPLQYLEIVTATTLGYWIFGDVIGPIGLLGVVIIVSSGLFLIWREQKQPASHAKPHATPPVAPSVPSPHRPKKF